MISLWVSDMTKPPQSQRTLYSSFYLNILYVYKHFAAASDQHSAEIKPSVNPEVDIVCMDGWSMWPCALLQNEETVRPVDLQQHHEMRARSVAFNTSQRTSLPLMI